MESNFTYNITPIKFIRFDDVCINADMDLINEITDFVIAKRYKVIWGVSPMVNDDCGQRVFPSILNAFSDFREFYKVDLCGIPELRSDVILAGHGLIHVDHRLLHYSAQELSILVSCSLLDANMFIPPFNKWDVATESICNEFNIELIKFEDGWLSMEYNQYDPDHSKYYLHAREWTLEKIKQWFNG